MATTQRRLPRCDAHSYPAKFELAKLGKQRCIRCSLGTCLLHAVLADKADYCPALTYLLIFPLHS